MYYLFTDARWFFICACRSASSAFSCNHRFFNDLMRSLSSFRLSLLFSNSSFIYLFWSSNQSFGSFFSLSKICSAASSRRALNSSYSSLHPGNFSSKYCSSFSFLSCVIKVSSFLGRFNPFFFALYLEFALADKKLVVSKAISCSAGKFGANVFERRCCHVFLRLFFNWDMVPMTAS